jgi:hypothetical protein
MGSALTDSLPKLLLRRSAAGPAAILPGRDAHPFFGPAFDRLLAQRVLAELAPATSWPPCSDCDCLFGERPIVEIDGVLVAECPDDAAASTVLDPSDLRSFAIDNDRLLALLAGGSGWPDPPECLGVQVWRLGDLPDGRTVILVLDPAAFTLPSLSSILRAVPAPTNTTLLVPPGVAPGTRRPFLDMRYHLVDLLAAMHPSDLRLDRQTLRPSNEMSATATGVGMLLSINTLGVTASFHGAPLRLRPRDFDALAVLARESGDGGALATQDDLLSALQGEEGRADPPRNEQMEKSISRIRGALCAAAGLPRTAGRTLIVNVTGRGYRLASPDIRVIIT